MSQDQPTAVVDSLPGRIDWRCGTCRRHIRTGMLHVSFADMHRAAQDEVAWSQRRRAGRAVNVPELLMTPRQARWRVDCDGCRHSCGDCYTIELSVCQSAFALIRWTDHLYGKSWFASTDWVRFIARVARENGSPSEPTGVW